MEQNNISVKIKEIRKQNNLTQRELGEKLGVTFQAVSKWENAVNVPDIAILNQISILFNIDINELINGENKKKPLLQKKKIFIICLIFLTMILVSIVVIYNTNFTNNMSLTVISTSSSDFELSGSLVKNNNTAVIYVSNIKYIGEKQEEIYESLNFKLIEDNNNSLKVIDELVISENELKFEEIVSKISFNVENYISDCETFNCNSLYIKVTGVDADGKTINLEIPFISIENCSCES